MQRLERGELYELVWQVPMIELGKRYGVSRDAIRFACTQLDVPLPPQGYWGSLRAGKVMERPALQPLQPDHETFLDLATLIERDAPRPRQHIRRSAPKPPLVERIFGVKPSQPEVPLVVVPAGYKWHPSIQPIRKQLDARAAQARTAKSRYDWEHAHPGKSYPYRDDSHTSWEYFVASGQILDTSHGKQVMRVSLNTYERGLMLLNDVVLAAIDAGFSVKKSDGKTPICLDRGGASVSLRLIERIKVCTRDSKDRSLKKIVQERYVVPSGRLDIIIDQDGLGETVVREDDFVDAATGMAKIMQALEKRHARSIAQVAQWAQDRQRRKEEELIRHREEKQRIAEQKLAEEEKQRRDALIREAQSWQQSEVLRLYLAELDRRLTAGGEPVKGYQDWRQWAEGVAVDLDAAALRVKLPRG
ncbi:hypothetical protein [Burkholderia lata]|uniref:hypothetical protein n=1 Tax=Burkholderia lata (strain ATCC 17760 / DSM 23089 / LMG 22485 / NCIMB 9086 / R18194 / 383) TaxID=482957 RepID=UPI001453D4A3|nr:hypothetical protein [Burkholderia lata]VWB67934.1 hypothetical protein BLA15816_03218 [Burkholderia lata]